jgi:hypothetical protein
MKIFVPRYRRSLVGLLLLVSLGVGLAYAEMSLLTTIVSSLTLPPDCSLRIARGHLLPFPSRGVNFRYPGGLLR